MSKWRKKPVEIEAFQWTGDRNQTEDPAWIIEAIKNEIVWFEFDGTAKVNMLIKTLEGTMLASRGDYIIKGVKGEIYPCKPDIFEMTYEKVNEIICPHCKSNITEYVDMVDENIDSYSCYVCDEYFYVETNGDWIVEVRKTKW